MTIYAFVGGAGTGKTYAVVEAIAGFEAKSPVGAKQRILGLTFMHGSRRRMDGRIEGLGHRAPPYRVSTIDSFALEVVRRFRRYCGISGEVRAAFAATDEGWQEDNGVWRAGLSTIRQTGAELLDRPAVRSTIAAAYPMVVIDEIQDCDGDLLEFVQRLSGITLFVCAGDAFQYLSADASPAMAWVESVASVRRLERQERITNAAVLESANALRSGLRAGASGVDIVEVKAAGLAAYEIQKRLNRKDWRGSAALLSPTQPGTSKFFRAVLKSLGTAKADGKVAPRPFTTEGTMEAELAAAAESACAPFSGLERVTAANLIEALREEDLPPVAEGACRNLVRRLRLTGQESVHIDDLAERARLATHAQRMYRSPPEASGRRAMTIHGAKNREFDQVFVLWPYEVRGEAEVNRRLLYNAITRARKNAVVIVQGEGRTQHDPVLSALR
jgi:superfamily I DNA/RNA helicase